MIVDDDHDHADGDDDAYDAAPLLTKNYGSCANASRLRLDPPSSKRRRSFAQRRRYFCLIYGCGLGLLVGGVLDVIFRIGPYRGKPKWRRRGYRWLPTGDAHTNLCADEGKRHYLEKRWGCLGVLAVVGDAVRERLPLAVRGRVVI